MKICNCILGGTSECRNCIINSFYDNDINNFNFPYFQKETIIKEYDEKGNLKKETIIKN